MKSKIICILSTILISSLVMFNSSNIKVKALYMEDSFYDSISWIYSYLGPYTSSYNCLGWATGSKTWEWPSLWGEKATNIQVELYLHGKGYNQVNLPLNNSTKIIAYGKYNAITHFAKAASGSVSAKWGQLELFGHSKEQNPYYSTSPYGSAVLYFY